MSSNRPIKITVPEPLAEEVRLIAKASRRSAQEVADAVFADIFDEYSRELLADDWFVTLRREMGGQVALDVEPEEVADEPDR